MKQYLVNIVKEVTVEIETTIWAHDEDELLTIAQEVGEADFDHIVTNEKIQAITWEEVE